MGYLFAVDPSLTSSGWALFSLKEQLPKLTGIISSKDASVNLSERLKIIQSEIEKLYSDLKLGSADILVCEGPAPLVLNPQSALKVEGVRGIFETTARARGILVPGRINPRTVQSELLGLKGKQLARAEVKRCSRVVALRLFQHYFADNFCDSQKKLDQAKISQDIIDATLIGAVAVSRINRAQKTGVDLLSLFGVNSIRSKSKRVSWENVYLESAKR
jgi:hypothetical protein